MPEKMILDRSSYTNVIFILTDDQGVWAAGCYGNHEIRTPNIDRLAETGVRFENFFVATPVCSPSRATLFTGRIPSQHGVHDWIRGGNVGPDAIRYMEGEVSYTDIMARHEYVCGICGKWHLGDSQHPQFSFTHWYVHQKGGGPYYDAPMVREGKLVNETGHYITNLITDEALKFIDAHANEPFYLSVHYTAPHSPWINNHPKEIVDSYDSCPFETCPQEPPHPWAKLNLQCFGNRECLKGYFAAVTAMDMDVGRILDRLEELGLRDKTLIIFMSDNGFSCGHHGIWGKGNATWPRNMYENSIKVPCIFSHPGRIPQGVVQREMISAYDFMPTLLEYLNLPLPKNRNLPGKSFLSLLLDPCARGREDVVIFDEYGPVRMIRTRRWKYVHRYPNGPNELYDLISDPDERQNLINDPFQKERIKELRSKMEAWFSKYVDPSCDGTVDDGTDPPNYYGQVRLVKTKQLDKH